MQPTGEGDLGEAKRRKAAGTLGRLKPGPIDTGKTTYSLCFCPSWNADLMMAKAMDGDRDAAVAMASIAQSLRNWREGEPPLCVICCAEVPRSPVALSVLVPEYCTKGKAIVMAWCAPCLDRHRADIKTPIYEALKESVAGEVRRFLDRAPGRAQGNRT
jgi:hypothetical protein